MHHINVCLSNSNHVMVFKIKFFAINVHNCYYIIRDYMIYVSSLKYFNKKWGK